MLVTGWWVKRVAINWHWCVPDQKLFQCPSWAGVNPAKEATNWLSDWQTGERWVWSKVLPLVSLQLRLDTDARIIKSNIYGCGARWLCLPLVLPTSRLVLLTFNGLSTSLYMCVSVFVCVIIIRAHLVELFVVGLTPFMGRHLWLCCMQSVPLEWQHHKNTFYCPRGSASRHVLSLVCLWMCVSMRECQLIYIERMGAGVANLLVNSQHEN